MGQASQPFHILRLMSSAHQPIANDVGSPHQRHSENPAVWSATAPTLSPTPGQSSQKVHMGVFLGSEGREHNVSGGGEATVGIHERRQLTRDIQSNHNKRTAKAQSRDSAFPPGPLAPDEVSPKPKDRALSRETVFNWAKELSGKFYFLPWQKKKR